MSACDGRALWVGRGCCERYGVLRGPAVMEWPAGWYEKDLCAVCLTRGYCAGILLGMTTKTYTITRAPDYERGPRNVNSSWGGYPLIRAIKSFRAATRYELRDSKRICEEIALNGWQTDIALPSSAAEQLRYDGWTVIDNEPQPLRTIVFTHGQIEPADNLSVKIVPADWDQDDIDRCLNQHTHEWTTAVVLTAEEATL